MAVMGAGFGKSVQVPIAALVTDLTSSWEGKIPDFRITACLHDLSIFSK